MRLQDKVAIITGGGGKVGKAYALGMAKEGAKLCLPDMVDASPVVKAITDVGGEAMSVECDVSNEASVQSMVEATVKRFGKVDILVNNAAYFMSIKKSRFWEMEVEEFDKAMAVNVRGVWLCAKAVFPHMKKQSKGKIINIASVAGRQGVEFLAHYAASKAGVIPAPTIA